MAPIKVPETLKSDLPQNSWGKILGATPIIMTVIATLLAGLASSEMTHAQFDRSTAAQLQSKVGDQWNFFQGKKLRGAVQRSTLDLMETTAEIHPLDRESLVNALAGTPAEAILATAGGKRALAGLTEASLPKVEPAPGSAPSAALKQALGSLDGTQTDEELAGVLSGISKEELEAGLRGAEAQAREFDALNKPVGPAIALIEKALLQRDASPAARRNFVAARITYEAARYDAEARLNQSVAGYYELQVHKANLSADRHNKRSKRFFYGMLAAQMGVVIATLAMAARKRSLLWSISAAAGAVAVSFAFYVYLYT